jgi:uncharacterized protein (TIGR02300 family)
MPAKDLGTKYICGKCGTKFYDLKKAAPICPKCGADQRESQALKSPPQADKRPRPVPKPAIEPELDEVGEEGAVEEDLEEPAEEEGGEVEDEES